MARQERLLDPNSPELIRIFRQELEERTASLVAGARSLRDRTLASARIPDLIRDAHTLKGSAGLLGLDTIREVMGRLEQIWRQVGEGSTPSPEVMVAMETSAGRLVQAYDETDYGEVVQAGEKLAEGIATASSVAEVIPLRPPDQGTLGGLLSSVSESLLGVATRVDTGDLYQLINRIVEASLDAEALADLALVTIEGSDERLMRNTWRRQLERLSDSIAEIQDQAVALANVPLTEVTATYHQFVRYLGRRLNKDVRFELAGEEVDIDRQIVDLIREPLRHLIVNAVDHGIEPLEERVKAGKPPTGTVKVASRVVDGQLEISVSDDGVGVDWDRVAEVADARGLRYVRTDLVPVLLEENFTTAATLSEFSGTGEGLTAARTAVEQVNGVIQVESRRGDGTTVIMTLPLSMVLQSVVVVATGDQFWAIPEAFVVAAMPLIQAELRSANGGRVLKYESSAVPCVSLSQALGIAEAPDESELIVVATHAGLVALTVTEIIDRRRVAVKNLGPIIEGSGQVIGAALLGGGQVLVVLDPNFLGVLGRGEAADESQRARILVVDDSVGVRQLLAATLNGAGFLVTVAGSAREAIQAVEQDDFAAMVVDYSMPRSNGVDLVRALRESDVSLPILMVSGVATAEEKEAAWDAGVDSYLDKFDLRQGVLIETLRALISGQSAGEGSA